MKCLLKPAFAVFPFTLATLFYSSAAYAQSAPVVDVCTGLSIDLPVLQPVASGLDALLQPLASLIDLNLSEALSGRNIGLTVLDTDGQAVPVPIAAWRPTMSLSMKQQAFPWAAAG